MLALLLIILLLPFYIISFYNRVSRYPPGPLPLPFFGDLLQVTSLSAFILQLPVNDMHKYITRLKEKYGPVYTVWQPHPVVYIQNYDHVKDALRTNGRFTKTL